jgi:hypothetical protein
MKASLAENLAKKHNDAENVNAAEFTAVATCRRCPLGGFSHGQTACEPASQGGGAINGITMKFHAIGDSSPPIPC